MEEAQVQELVTSGLLEPEQARSILGERRKPKTELNSRAEVRRDMHKEMVRQAIYDDPDLQELIRQIPNAEAVITSITERIGEAQTNKRYTSEISECEERPW